MIDYKNLLVSSLGLALAGGINLASAGNILTEDFESYSTECDAAIGQWKWREMQYSDASCQTFSGVYPEYSEAAAQLHNLFACAYYNIAGIAPSGDANAITGQSLALADNAESNSTACHRIQAALEVVSGGDDLGEGQPVIYTLKADVKSNQYGDNNANSDVGVFITILDIDAGYSAIFEDRVSVVPSSGSVEETFTFDLTGKSNILVQAGFYAQADGDEQSQAQWDNFTLDWAVNDDEAAAQEAAACADTGTLDSGTLDWDDGFGGAEMTCLTDTYVITAGAEDYAGFGDGNEDDATMYPLFFPDGGSITFDCSTESGDIDVWFVLESNPYPANDVVFQTGKVNCSAAAARGVGESVSIPAGGQPWNNLLLYLDVADENQEVVIKNIRINGSREYVPPPAGIPVLPWWALFGLSGLVALVGWFRRRPV